MKIKKILLSTLLVLGIGSFSGAANALEVALTRLTTEYRDSTSVLVISVPNKSREMQSLVGAAQS